MNTKTTWLTVIGIAAVIILAVLTYMLMTAAPSTTTGGIVSQPTTATTASSGTVAQPVSAQRVSVTYANGVFSPNPVQIKKGDTVMFMNNSSGNIRVAGDPHPMHTGYPTTGGCVGSTFDSCASIAPSASWSFTFDITGSWGYHNHMAPGERGMVIVK